MITLTVISFNGAPSDGSLSASFDELGGTIGRADTNQLVLPDPERTISRVHAQVAFRNGKYVVVDRGSNPVSVNNRPVGSGKEAPINHGDQIQIGGYLVEVRPGMAMQKALDDPFGDLLGPGAAPARGGAAAAPAFIDPLAAFGAPAPAPAFGGGVSAPVADPFAMFSPPAAPAAPARDPFGARDPFASPASAPAKAPSASGIPDDWDPFAPDPVAAKPAARDLGRSLGQGGGFGLDTGGGAAAPLIPDLPSGGGGNDNSLDNLFGLKGGGGSADPLANSVLDAPMARPNMASNADPMASLKAAPRASADTLQDSLSDLHSPFIPAPAPRTISPPAPVMPAPVMPPPAMPAAAPVVAPPLPTGAVLSWDDAPGDGRTVINPRGLGAAGAPPVAPRPVAAPPAASSVDPFGAFGMAPPPSAPAPAPIAAAFVPAPAPASAPAAAHVGAASGADVRALLEAFREGLAAPTVPIEALTPELMKLIGQLIHESARGTVDLLVARAALKREIRAESTMIVARENNPLKFSPSVEAALGHLMAPPTRGFMPAGPAMRDAYDDLRAHQFGFVAGMKAALDGVLERFDPAALEGRLTQRSAIQSLLPGSRKARLWELFNELYAQIRSEASDDFHTVFGKAFLKAYEEHIDQLKGGGR